MTRATQPTPFHEVLEYLGDGSTNEVLAQGLADLVQRVCTTGKKGTVTLVVSVVPADDGRVEITDKVSVKMPELYRPPVEFDVDEGGALTVSPQFQPPLAAVSGFVVDEASGEIIYEGR